MIEFVLAALTVLLLLSALSYSYGYSKGMKEGRRYKEAYIKLKTAVNSFRKTVETVREP